MYKSRWGNYIQASGSGAIKLLTAPYKLQTVAHVTHTHTYTPNFRPHSTYSLQGTGVISGLCDWRLCYVNYFTVAPFPAIVEGKTFSHIIRSKVTLKFCDGARKKRSTVFEAIAIHPGGYTDVCQINWKPSPIVH